MEAREFLPHSVYNDLVRAERQWGTFDPMATLYLLVYGMVVAVAVGCALLASWCVGRAERALAQD